METIEKQFRSVSQLKQYKQCNYQWYLAREKLDDQGERIWQRPAAWFPQGSAVHEAVEWFEKTNRTGSLNEMLDVFTEAYDREVNKYTEVTPNLSLWFDSSWRYPADKDIPRRHEKGLEQTERYYRYVTEVRPHDTLLRLPNGDPFVEIGFEMQLGEVWVRGYIDQVYWDDKAKRWRVRDVKTGKKPGDEVQLAVYAVAVNREHGTSITTGDYWMAVSGKPTVVIDLSDWPESRVEDEFSKLEQGIRSESFEPNPSPDNCKFCPVAAACEFAVFS